MARIINLATHRKQKARAERRAQASENAAKFGRSRAEKDLEQKTRQALARHLDRHKNEKRDQSD